jgi:Ca-activated chloride channel family protein
MSLLHPEALLVLVPLVPLAVALCGGMRRARTAFALTFAALWAVALALPLRDEGVPGADVIVVEDRSASMPEGSLAAQEEVRRLVAAQRGRGDRLAVVAFGEETRALLPPTEGPATLDPGRAAPGPGASDLAGGLRRALDLVPRGRPARILLHSDGEATGRDPRALAREAARRGIAIDHRLARRSAPRDAAWLDLRLPDRVRPREPFALFARAWSSHPVVALWRLERDGEVLAEGEIDLPAGTTRLQMRDRVEKPGLVTYTLELEAGADRVPQNDRARAVLEVVGPRRVLLARSDGKAGNLARALAETGIAVETLAPEALPRRLEGYADVAAVLLENVPATALPPGGLETLARFVTETGGGLVLTGAAGPSGSGATTAPRSSPSCRSRWSFATSTAGCASP